MIAADHVAEKISLRRARAVQCRLNALKTRNATEEVAWLDLANDWDNLADALQDENPKQIR
jgi:hypothetical protein